MAGLTWSYPATDHGEIPAQKGGRAAPSIALAVATAHKHDAKGTVKASKSLSGQRGSSLVCAHCHGLPSQESVCRSVFATKPPPIFVEGLCSSWGMLNPSRQCRPSSTLLRSLINPALRLGKLHCKWKLCWTLLEQREAGGVMCINKLHQCRMVDGLGLWHLPVLGTVEQTQQRLVLPHPPRFSPCSCKELTLPPAL